MSDLINTLESPGEFDALSTLRPDEPYFILCGRDRLAPKLIYDWADQRRRQTLKEFDAGNITKEARDFELRKCTEAETIASGMVEYKNGDRQHRDKEERVTSYSGHELPDDVKHRDELQAARNRTASLLNNVTAEVDSLRQMLAREDSLAILCEHVIAQMQSASEQITARRVVSPAPLLDHA